ncbi:MAG: SCO family protein [Bacteroidota bacterium]
MTISPGAAKAVIIAVFIVPVVIYLYLYNFSRPVRENVPFVYQVENGDSTIRELPEFSLYNLAGEEVSKSDLLGKISFVSFFSIKEDTLTKVLHGNLQRTYKNLNWERDPNLRFFHINTGDSLSELESYLDKMNEVDPRYWVTLRGSDSVIHEFAGKSLDLPKFRQASKEPYQLTSQYVGLFDKEGRLRKFYIGTDLAHERKMQEDIIALMRMEYPEELER